MVPPWGLVNDTCWGVEVQLHLFSTQPRDKFSGHMLGVEVELHPFSTQKLDKNFVRHMKGSGVSAPPILNPVDTCWGVEVELHPFSTQPSEKFSGHILGSGGRAPPILNLPT